MRIMLDIRSDSLVVRLGKPLNGNGSSIQERGYEVTIGPDVYKV